MNMDRVDELAMEGCKEITMGAYPCGVMDAHTCQTCSRGGNIHTILSQALHTYGQEVREATIAEVSEGYERILSLQDNMGCATGEDWERLASDYEITLFRMRSLSRATTKQEDK